MDDERMPLRDNGPHDPHEWRLVRTYLVVAPLLCTLCYCLYYWPQATCLGATILIIVGLAFICAVTTWDRVITFLKYRFTAGDD